MNINLGDIVMYFMFSGAVTHVIAAIVGVKKLIDLIETLAWRRDVERFES